MEINVEGVGNVRISTDSHITGLVKEMDHHLDAIIYSKMEDRSLYITP